MLEETLIEWRDKILREADQIKLKARWEGRHEGQIQGMRKVLLEQMALRFGRLPANVRRQVEEISSIQELRRLGRKVVRAKSLEEMGLNPDREGAR
ncbi:MAG TPA: transposase [Thermoanaerobaculia bacterium]